MKKKLVFWKIQMILLKTILNKWFQFTYLQNIFFKWFDSISFVFNFQKKLFTLTVSKEFITKFQFGNKIIFTCFYKKWMNFYNFIYKSIFIYFHLRKVIHTNYLNKYNFICKRIFNKKKTFITSFTKMLKFNSILLRK